MRAHFIRVSALETINRDWAGQAIAKGNRCSCSPIPRIRMSLAGFNISLPFMRVDHPYLFAIEW